MYIDSIQMHYACGVELAAMAMLSLLMCVSSHTHPCTGHVNAGKLQKMKVVANDHEYQPLAPIYDSALVKHRKSLLSAACLQPKSFDSHLLYGTHRYYYWSSGKQGYTVSGGTGLKQANGFWGKEFWGTDQGQGIMQNS